MRLKFRSKSVLLAILIFFLLAACNQDGTEENSETSDTAEVNQANVQFIPFVDDELGVSAQYPANWVTQSAFGGATFASDQSAIDAESLAEIGEEAFVVIIPGEISQFNFQTSQSFNREEVLQALATYKLLLEREGQQFVTVEQPEAFTSTNQNMARIVLRSIEDDEPIITVMAVIMSDTHMALVSAASLEETAEEMRPIFYQIIDSIQVRAPGGFSGKTEE